MNPAVNPRGIYITVARQFRDADIIHTFHNSQTINKQGVVFSPHNDLIV